MKRNIIKAEIPSNIELANNITLTSLKAISNYIIRLGMWYSGAHPRDRASRGTLGLARLYRKGESRRLSSLRNILHSQDNHSFTRTLYATM